MFDHFRDQPDFQRFGRTDHLAGEGHLGGFGHADQLRQQERPTIPGDDAQLHEAFGEARLFRRDTDVAHAGQIAARADSGPVHGGDGRDLQIVEGQRNVVDVALIVVANLVGATFRQALAVAHVLDIAAGGKSAARAGENHAFDAVVAGDFIGRVQKGLVLALARERIARLGLVHGQGDDRAVLFVDQKITHRFLGEKGVQFVAPIAVA